MIDIPTLQEIAEILILNRTVIDGGCWTGPWSTRNPKGYAQIWFPRIKRTIEAHRVSAALYHRLDLRDPYQYACHKPIICNNKVCWNPDHLYNGNSSTNSFDTLVLNPLLGYQKQEFCRKGHLMSGANRYRCKTSSNKKGYKEVCLACMREYKEKNKEAANVRRKINRNNKNKD